MLQVMRPTPCLRSPRLGGVGLKASRVAAVVRYRLKALNHDKLELFSPSKVNLFLRVMRRREDGYHDLASLFHVIDLGDEMDFQIDSTGSKDSLTCSDPSIPSDDSNLVIKALNLFRRKTNQSIYFKVGLSKRVPHGAGLGGGSGNAATTLWAANKLTGNQVTDKELLAWSGEIGSDISVFFSNGAAYCTGRGEVVEDVPSPVPSTTPFLLVKPPVGLATPRIFKALDLDLRSTADPRALLAHMGSQGLSQEVVVNDLERPAFTILPELEALKHRLIAAGSPSVRAVFMTGSGSTIVVAGDDGVPAFLSEPQYKDMFIAATRLITRKPDSWYRPSAQV